MAAFPAKRNEEMKAFWASLPPKVKSSLWFGGRRLVMSSDEVPLSMAHQSRLSISNLKTAPKYYLFTDAFVMLQGTTVTEFPLEIVWVEHIIPTDTLQIQSLQHMSSFRLVFPESVMELQCKELVHKSMWVTTIADYIGSVLSLPLFVHGRGDLNLDTKLELLKNRECLEYTFRSLPDVKDGKYKGHWKNSKPSGPGEFTQESTGVHYKGEFKDGKFHGQGEMHWFQDKDMRKKYIGDFKNGTMDGHGEMKYSNGHIYSGRWLEGQRSGFGKVEESSRKSSFYIGGWKADKRHGYGIYEDKLKHERYLGAWSDDVRCGPGLFVTSSGTYCEAVFANGAISPGNDGFVVDPNGRSFIGKLGPDLKLAGKGLLELDNGTKIEGTFSGSWSRKIEIVKGVLEDSSTQRSAEKSTSRTFSDLQIAKLDKRIGNCTVLACNKWQEIFKECESSLGVSGDATNDVFSAWSKLASDAFHRRTTRVSPQTLPATSSYPPRRSNSLTGLHGRTVKVPVQLIPLERARAQTSVSSLAREESLMSSIRNAGRSFAHANSNTLEESFATASIYPENPGEYRPTISRPINLEESSLCCSYPSGLPYKANMPPYAPQADFADGGGTTTGPPRSSSTPTAAALEEKQKLRESDIETAIGPGDVRVGIQNYVDKAFNTPDHPLGALMNRIELVYRLSYGGVGASKFLLSHAIAETHSIIQRIHYIVRILFPFLSNEDKNLTCYGYSKAEESIDSADPDDYVSIESGYALLHSLVFIRLFPTLIHLYVLHHDEDDLVYQKGLNLLKEMDDDRFVRYIRFPDHLCTKLVGKSADSDIVKSLDEASNTLRVITSLFTPGEFLEHFKMAFKQLSSIEQLCGDFLLPAAVFILVRANVSHLGAYLHFLMDFAHTQPEDEYILVTYEASYNFIKRNSHGSGLH